ncbi:CBO0543 family protein [Gracilibacillus sp. YIM 98692]|uniref:CBO0543 family protein n=1 Tax=Gracilibacillus sp. YIM 98692 TaxID=2663532 RepID=UPI001F093CA0|nr:CBO0543 family protein [Gracilibacillus sp. YIM 98692]
MTGNSTWDEIVKLRLELRNTNLEYWLNENLFTFSWWMLMITAFFLAILWWYVLDKSKMLEIVLYGLFVTTTVILLDIMGVSFVLWGYPNMLTPLVPPIVAIDIIHIPFIYMLVYQHFFTWRSFFIAITTTSIVFSFILEPMAVWVRIYEMHNWKHIYSLPIYIFIGVFFKWLILKMNRVTEDGKLTNGR